MNHRHTTAATRSRANSWFFRFVVALGAAFSWFLAGAAHAEELPPKQVRVAGVVLKWLRGDKEANYRRAEALIEQAARGKAQIVCTTECFLDGYAIKDKTIPLDEYRALGEPIPGGDYYRRLAALADRLDIFLIAGMLEADGEDRYNTAVVIGPAGELVGKYRKHNLEHEAVRNTPGSETPTFATPLGRIGVMICADRRDTQLVKRLCDAGAELLLCPSGGMFGPKRNDPILQARSKENGVPIVFVHPAEFLVTDERGDIRSRTILGDRLEIEDDETDGAVDQHRVFFFDLPAAAKPADRPPQPANTWIKHSPQPEAPVSPRLGYEGACVWDSRRQLLVRYGGHNQGGGGEQGAEVWTFDLRSAQWTLKEPNTSPPGVCCNAQNVYNPVSGRYVRFPFFSGGHGWQWSRELYLNDSSVWTYDLGENRWRNMRPLPTPRLAPYRCASWDSDHEVVVVFGGEGSHEGTLIYDPWRNEWRWPKPATEPPPRSGGNMAYDAARKLHVLFGSQFTNDPHTWLYDVARNEWRDAQPDAQPPTDKNDAVLTYDPLNQVVLAIIKVTTGDDENASHELQTWAYDAGANRWTRVNPQAEPDASGNRARNLVFAPELNLAILENCTSRPREQQVWTYRYADADKPYQANPPKPRETPPIVEDAVVSVVSPTRVELTWTAPAGVAIAGYHVERAVVEVWSDDQLRRLKQKTPPLAEPSVGAIRRIGPFQPLTTELLDAASYVDEGVNLDAPQTVEGEPVYDRDLHDEHLDRNGRPYRRAVYAYRIRAVDGAGSVSGPSPAFFTIPSSPQQVFSREGGETCQLKWAANPERGVVGYRVYRLDGRWDRDTVSRLTADPVAATAYDDPTAGKATRRYYVVAVDALGQEGFPSSPVWFQREWREFYKPFVSEWHQ